MSRFAACPTMQDFIPEPIQPARIDWRGHTPFARDYGDSYFTPGAGLAESQAVFIEANALARRFASLPEHGLFVIGETGFGTGLNMLLAAECFLRAAPRTARLHFLSAELHPLSREDLERAVAHWPQLRYWSEALLAQWPAPAPGFHRLSIHPRVDVTLMLGDAEAMWRQTDAGVDAWFLDGFAPARNPALWNESLWKPLVARSRPGATLSTFTAAGAVRRGLSAAGFDVERIEGFGGKRHRLVGRRAGTWRPAVQRRGEAVVLGAGFAGCTTARALAERGWQVRIFDPALGRQPAELSAVLYTTASHHLIAQNRFYLGAFAHAQRWLARLGFPRDESDGMMEGVVQQLVDPRVAGKTRQAMAQGTWPAELLSAAGDQAVRFAGGGCLNVTRWCAFLLDHPAITAHAVGADFKDDGPRSGWMTESGKPLTADAIVLCTAGHTREFPGYSWLPLRIVRGQVSFCRPTAASRPWRQPHCHTGYLTPAVNDVHCIGATFDRRRETPVIDAADDEHNLAELQRHLPDRWRALGAGDLELIGHHAGLRCQSPDKLPLVGPLPDPSQLPHSLDPGTWLNIAHGSKGLTHTPLCAELIADRLSGHPAPIDAGVVDALAPERFIKRWRRRDPAWRPGA